MRTVSRREFLKLSAAGAAGALALPKWSSAAEPPAGAKPNIVHIILDDWGYYEASCMGHPTLATPNIDRLAKEGMRLPQMNAGGPVCGPSRCALLTGLHTGHCSVRDNPGGTPIRAEEVTFGQVLKGAGYATGGFGKWGIGDRGTTGVPEKHGFDVFFGYYHQVHAHSYYPNYLLRNSEKVPLPGNTGDLQNGQTYSQYLIVREALSFIRANKDKPFFAYLPWTPPHGTFAIPETDPAWQKYKDQPAAKLQEKTGLVAKPQAKAHLVRLAMIEMVDRQVGEVLALLKELGLEDRTLVMLSGDNGSVPEAHVRDAKTGKAFRGYKGSLYEGGLRVFFAAMWPGKIKPGTVSEQVCYFPDVFATIADLAGAKPPDVCDGLSLVPTLLGEDKAGKKQAQHEFLYWEFGNETAVRMGDWKAVRHTGKKAGGWELYDLAHDAEEANDVAKDHADIVAKIDALATAAHKPVQPGSVLDAEAGFKNHKAT
jgi:arylsulfatase A-like enzyme